MLITNHLFVCGAGQELASKREKLKNMLTKISQFLHNRELSSEIENLRSIFTSLRDTLVRLMNSVEEIHHLEEPKNKEIMEEEIGRRYGKALDKPFANRYIPSFSAYHVDVQPQRALWTSSEPPMPEFYDARGMPEGMAPGDDIETKGRDYVTTRLEDISYRGPLETEYPVQSPQIDMEWSSTLQNSSLFDADPFQILIVLLSVSIALFRIFLGSQVFA